MGDKSIKEEFEKEFYPHNRDFDVALRGAKWVAEKCAMIIDGGSSHKLNREKIRQLSKELK